MNQLLGKRVRSVLIGLLTGFLLLTCIPAISHGTDFPEEKLGKVQLEGMWEEVRLQRYLDLENGYVFYYDLERLKRVEDEQKAKFVPIHPLPEPYPEVSLTIERVDLSPQELTSRKYEELVSSYGEVENPREIEDPNGWFLFAHGEDWDSEVLEYYIVSDGKKGSYLITSKFFVSAYEGWGQRLHAMVKEFMIIPQR
ncbi:hypothetical protein IC620_16015 [Hazenella sp. IB182357]|uniref:Uncharacterized protein n=1 Tax=Polycladospora coralii TaxID=2771432 RepID=A0A926NBH4_9BACL|nr:hypothetical protein [Polycladospora coralii]MBD1373851.1 hypothetical protein [Polycladospora coralii]